MISRAKNVIRGILPKNTSARGVSVLVGGTAGAQIISVLAAPLLTRLYGPEDFGMVAVFGSLLVLIGVVSSLSYELAIPLPEDGVEAANVAVLSLLLLVLTTVLSGVLVALLATPVAEALGAPVLAGYLWLLPVGVLLAGGYSVFNYWSVRTKQFGTVASTRIRQSLATLVIQVAAFKLGGLALLLGQVAGQIVGTGGLARRALAMSEFRQVSWEGAWQSAVRYRRFPIFTTWAGLFNTGGTQLPPLIIAAFFSAAGAGLYALAHRVLTLPLSLIGSALQSVFLSNAAEAHRSNQLGEIVKRLLDILVQIAVIPAAILVLTAPGLFSIIFGEDWRQAGALAQWMTPWLLLQFCTGPLAIVNAVVEKQHLDLILQAQLFVVRIIMLAVGAYYGDIVFAIMLFSIGSAVSYFIFLWVVLSTVGLSIKTFIKFLVRASAFAFVVVVPILFFPDFLLDWSRFAFVTLAVFGLVGVRFFILYRYQY